MARSAPSARTASCLPLPAAPITRAQSFFAICTAAEPTPPAAGVTSSVSDGRSRAISISPIHAVR